MMLSFNVSANSLSDGIQQDLLAEFPVEQMNGHGNGNGHGNNGNGNGGNGNGDNGHHHGGGNSGNGNGNGGSGGNQPNPPAVRISEPGTLVLMGIALLAAGFVSKRR